MGTRSSAAPAAAKAAAETHTTEKMTSGKQATTPTGGHSRVPKREREEPENQDGEPLLKKVKTANLSPKADDGLMASLPGDVSSVFYVMDRYTD